MTKRNKDDEDVTEENVEKYIVKALKKYREINQMVDFWFWRIALPLFKKKIEHQTLSEFISDKELAFFVGTQGYKGNGKWDSPQNTDKTPFKYGATLTQKMCKEYDRRMKLKQEIRKNQQDSSKEG